MAANLTWAWPPFGPTFTERIDPDAVAAVVLVDDWALKPIRRLFGPVAIERNIALFRNDCRRRRKIRGQPLSLSPWIFQIVKVFDPRQTCLSPEQTWFFNDNRAFLEISLLPRRRRQFFSSTASRRAG